MVDFLFVKRTLDSSPVILASIYAPNDGQIAFLRQTFIHLTTFAHGQLILAGDHNYVVDIGKDKSHFRKNLLKRRKTTLTQLDFLLKRIWFG